MPRDSSKLGCVGLNWMELALAPTPVDLFPLNLMVGLQMKELAPGNSRKVLLELGMGTTGPCSLVAKA